MSNLVQINIHSRVVDGAKERCSYIMEVVIRKSEIVIRKVNRERKWLLKKHEISRLEKLVSYF
jgi:tmRNA-binding protein